MGGGKAILVLVALAISGSICSAEYVYYGCVGDGPARALPGLIEASPAMTVDRCREKARNRNQAVFGVQYGVECYGGTNLTSTITAYGNSTNCNMGCAGNSSQVCGGGYALSLYHNANLTAEQQNITTAYTYQGCYAEAAGGERRMSYLWVDSNMTIAFCARLAKAEGYSLFGLQYVTECWGSNRLDFVTAVGVSTSCNTPCGGNSSQICGGPLALSVYNVSELTAPVSPSPSPSTSPPPVFELPANVTLVGCYADTFARLVPTPLRTSAQMTVALCAELAAAGRYSVFGIQYTAECWGGTNLTLATSAGNSTACTMTCYQMPVGYCGGPLANTIYTQTLAEVTFPSPLPSPSPSPAPTVNSTLNLTSYGCYADRFPPERTMALLEASATMTVDRCANLAYSRGYRVIGVQYGQECYAGVNITLLTRYGPATNCDSACYVDPPRSCGGGLANSLYLLPPLPANVTPATDINTGAGAPPPVSPSPSPSVPPGQLSSLNITVLGCYADSFALRALPVLLRASATMTVDECAQLAYSSNAMYTVVGIQYSSECYAGKNETRALQYGPSTGCNSVCYDTVRNPVGTCGGGLANSIYLLPYRAPPPPPPPSPYNETFIGCYGDGEPRALDTLMAVDTANMTVVRCAQLARDGGYTVFALQFGQECWASHNLTRAKGYGVSEACTSLCTGNPDQTCGGPTANQVYTIAPPPPPNGTADYTYLGCYADDQVFDTAQTPPTPMKRRMWRRLGQNLKMNDWECARRAEAAGYPYFGLTAGEVYPVYGKQCWGGFNLTHITALGNSTGCVNPCHPWPESYPCGGDYAISLFRLSNVTHDTGLGGEYQYLLEMPVSGSHGMQVTGKDQYLLIDFLDAQHPPTWDGKNTTYMYFRGNNTFRPINNIRDASCGQWHRMPDGDLMGFSGYFGASGVNEYSVWATMWYHRHQYNTEDFGERALPYGRWYGGAMTMPDGRSYVTGGDLGPGSPRALGSDVWDPAHKTWVGRFNNMGENAPYLPINQPLFEASTVGGYYPHLYVLPSGAYLFAQSKTFQVINPLTGAALAAAPPLPVPNYWEYPVSGSQVVLRAPVLGPNQRTTFYFIVFGGGDQAAYFKPCTDFSLRIAIHVDCTSTPCSHSMGEWEVETMLGSRCQLDTVVLPNGKVLLIGGTEEGYSGLGTLPNTNNCPVNEPWIYDPSKPAGQRYRRTGAYTRIPRLYHASHFMTSQGDILAAGTTIAKFFNSYHLGDFDITPYNYQEFRIELFKPSYILGSRPTWSFVPTVIMYGEMFTVKISSSASSISAVVLADPGTTTHSSNMATRMQELAFTVVDATTLRVTAPANTFIAPPNFYQLYLVASDDSYSIGAWVKLRGPWGSIPLSLPRVSQFEATASTRAEALFPSVWTVNAAGSAATLNTWVSAAAGSGSGGLRLTASNAHPIVIAGPAISVTAGTRVHLFVWARAPVDNTVHMEFIMLSSTNAETGSKHDPYGDFKVAVSDKYEQFPMGGLVAAAAGAYKPALRITGMTANMRLHLDDIEVFTLTSAAAAQSLQWARDGIEVEDQLGSRRRKLLDTVNAPRKLQVALNSSSSNSVPAYPAVDIIEDGTVNGWMGILGTDTLRAEKPEVLAELQTRDDPLADWNPLGNLTIPHMHRGMHLNVPDRDWEALRVLGKNKD